jgi:hypothetical protein
VRKAFSTGSPCAAAAALAVVAAFAGVAVFATGAARGAVLEFNTAEDLAGFSQRTTGAANANGSPEASSGIQFDPAAGRMGSGGLTHIAGGTTDVALVYQGQSFDLTTGTNSLSGFFRTPATVNPTGTGATFQIGFSANNNTALYGEAGNNFISTRVTQATSAQNAFRVQTQIKTAAGGTAATDLGTGVFTLEPNTWYRLAADFTHSATPNTFDYSTVLENWGADGSALVSTVQGPFTGTVANADVYNDPTTFAAFRSQEVRPTAALDSFTAVPEPSSALVMVAGLGLLAGSRRRRSP